MDERKQWNQKVSKWMQGENRRLLVIPILLLIGSYLLLSPGGTKASRKGDTSDQAQETFSAYEQSLEKRLESLLSCVEGAGKTQVMVTLESTQLNVYATDVRDSMGGMEQTHILLEDGGALTETVETPEVGGVAVVCEGGGNATVAAQITEIVSSLLGLSTGRISVTKMY